MPPESDRLSSASSGLTTERAKQLLAQYGFNAVTEERPNPLRNLGSKLWAPVPWMLEVTILLELLLHKNIEAGVILALLVFNAGVSFLQEGHAQRALALLRRRLAIQVRVRRDDVWQRLPSENLVPGDLIHLRTGDVIPADVRLAEGDILVDHSAVTGESMPVDVSFGGTAYAGGMVRRGEATALVSATAGRTFFGKTAELVKQARTVGHLQQTIFTIVRYLIACDIVLVAGVLGYAWRISLGWGEILPFCLMLLIASVPVALPATFTLASALGTQELARRGVLVSRLSAIEEAAAMDTLAADKTGTLTLNELSLEKVTPIPPYSEADVIRYAALASDEATQDPIDLAILAALRSQHLDSGGFLVRQFIPFEPSTKRSEALVERGQETLRVVKGAPASIAALTKEPSRPEADKLAGEGYRVLAVAAGPVDHLATVGWLALLDPPRNDSRKLVEDFRNLGVRVLMITGDGLATARAVAKQVGIAGAACPAEALRADLDGAATDCSIFAGVFPEDKYHLVESLQRSGRILGMTGDGVNDAPALKQAEVGIAVSNATDVAKAAASLVLTNPGLGDVVSAVETSRRIYQRMLTYTLNKIIKTLEISLFLTLGLLFTGSLVVTPVLIVLLLFTNDFVTMSIATDHVSFSERPDRWHIRSLMLRAAPLAAFLLLFSLAVLFAGRNLLMLGHGQIQTLAFLTLVFGGQGTVYLVRERGHFWRSAPSLWMLVTSLADIAAVSVLASAGILMAPLPFHIVLTLFLAILLYLSFVDSLKVRMFRAFSVH